jgi:hypothetical protein
VAKRVLHRHTSVVFFLRALCRLNTSAFRRDSLCAWGALRAFRLPNRLTT